MASLKRTAFFLMQTKCYQVITSNLYREWSIKVGKVKAVFCSI